MCPLILQGAYIMGLALYPCKILAGTLLDAWTLGQMDEQLNGRIFMRGLEEELVS